MEKHTTDRRTVLRYAGGFGAAGALGSLAGCAGGGGGDGDGDGGDGSGGGSPAGDGGGGGDAETETEPSAGGGSETVSVTFWSFLAAENRATKEHFQESMKTFESRNETITVDMEALNSKDLTSKIASVVNSGTAPDLSEHGSAGLEFYLGGKAADHNAYFEETGLADEYTQANVDSATFRGDFWTGGGNRHLITLLGIRTKFFEAVGVEDPSDIATWTDFRRALDEIDEQFPNVHAYEETGVWNDLESYWGQARTAFTGGEDPWIDGDPTAPTVKIGQDDRTDGMIENTVDLANAYSSPESASRGDEELPALLLSEQAASFTYGLGSPIRYRSVKEDATFGWDGEIWQGPIPKLDANYGEEFGIDKLAGTEGEHGGHFWALEFMTQVMEQSEVQDAAFTLLTYLNTSEEHNLELLTEHYPAAASYTPLNETILDEFAGDMPQIQQQIYELPETYGEQYNTTGAAWDVKGTDQIRWTDINQTISESIAGQIERDRTVETIRERVLQTLAETE